jgi:hypothetical protein
MQALLDQSNHMEAAFHECLSRATYERSQRALITGSMCSLAFDHGSGLRQLLGNDNPSSALALFRCQFEIVVRAAWTAFAANDDWLSRFTAPVETLDEPVPSPSMDKMLIALGNSGPRRLHHLLNELRAAAWKPLHSYVHGGVRPVAETLTGYHHEFLRKTLLNSNGLTAMAGLIQAGQSTDPTLGTQILDIQYRFLSCLPPRGLRK